MKYHYMLLSKLWFLLLNPNVSVVKLIGLLFNNTKARSVRHVSRNSTLLLNILFYDVSRMPKLQSTIIMWVKIGDDVYISLPSMDEVYLFDIPG